jgi:hypothetical protein
MAIAFHGLLLLPVSHKLTLTPCIVYGSGFFFPDNWLESSRNKLLASTLYGHLVKVTGARQEQ